MSLPNIDLFDRLIFYFCHFIVKFRNLFIAQRGNISHIGINALHHQSGTMHCFLRHKARKPLRAQNDGVERACSFKPMPCHFFVKP